MPIPKEDFQALGSLVEKAISKEEVFQYPVTTPPLNLVNADGSLRCKKHNYPSYSNCNRLSIR